MCRLPMATVSWERRKGHKPFYYNTSDSDTHLTHGETEAPNGRSPTLFLAGLGQMRTLQSLQLLSTPLCSQEKER